MEEQRQRSKLSAPTYPTITLPPPRAAVDYGGLFPNGSGLSPGPMTLVSSFFSDPDSTNRSFCQLLAGAMASPGAKLPYNSRDCSFMEVGFEKNGPLNFPGLSPSGFFCLSPQSPFGISHQQALAQVTAQAAVAQSQPEYRTLSVPAPWEQSNSNPRPGIGTESEQRSASDTRSSVIEYSGASQLDKKGVDKPAEDGYNWRKYGQKHIKGCEYPRSYYKCTHPNCRVRKIVERSAEGQITEIVYKSVHNHEKANGGGDGNTNSQAATGNLNNLNEVVNADSIPGNDHEPTRAVELSGLSDGEERCDEESREERDNDEPNQKRRNTAGEAAVVLSHKTATEAKLIVQTRSEVDLLADGYRWRKYGQKVVKGNPHPRSYYKCTSAGCNVRKHVERASSDPKAVVTTYEGKHNHDVPAAAKNSSHNAVGNGLPRPKSQHDGISEKPVRV
ncbi:probable WRKY transcription factor 4 isoform X1 [Hibiscus syriacus]|uniref:probable WRKY transcription factor 4 isoform X1 n=1 Tax=Hibiscus syriacus TaxID=106335 RepID=UPI0019217990|nr:probable WRKY transcription factor 4 isoform X1 [Hibiscus syriacus]